MLPFGEETMNSQPRSNNKSQIPKGSIFFKRILPAALIVCGAGFCSTGLASILPGAFHAVLKRIHPAIR